MEETKPDYIKEMKKNCKLIKEIGRYAQFISFLLLAIIILLAFTPHAYALNNTPYNATWAAGSSYAGHIGNYSIDDNLSTFSQGGGTDAAILYYINSAGTTQALTGVDVYFQESLGGGYEVCINPPYAPYISNASNYCHPSPFTMGWKHYDFPEVITANRLQMKLGWVKIVEIDYSGTAPITDSFSFTAIPSTGNASLAVTFTPTVSNESNINRIVWDFDGGLGSETKYNDDSFVKTYTTAGHYTATGTLYTLTGSVLTASQRISAYNYTLGITPTPTLTPTPTPTPQSSATRKFNVYGYDVSNYTNISSLSISLIDADDVAKGWFNVTASNGEYTFAGYGTGGNTPFVDNHHYMLVLSKTGYETLITPAYAFNPADIFTYGVGGGYAMRASSFTPSASTFTLAVRLISTTTGELTNGVTGTIVLTNQSSSWSSTTTNPAGGINYFSGLTPSASYKINVNVNGYESYTEYFASSSSMAGTTQEFLAYLTPSNQLPSAFTLAISPDSGTVNDTYSIKLNGDISSASLISYKYSTANVWGLNLVASSGYTQYSKVTGSWLGWSGSSYSVATANPAQVTGKLQPTINPETSTITVTAYITINGNVYQATDTINIVAIGKEPIMITARDMSTISSGADRSNTMDTFNSHILDLTTGIWTNATYDNTNFWTAYYYYTPNSVISFYGSATGYYDTVTETKVLPATSGLKGIEYKFYKYQMPPTASNTTLHVNVRTIQSQPLPQAKITLNDGQKCYANEQGSCTFYVLLGGSYSASAQAYGYSGGVSPAITTTNSSANVINLVLIRASTTTSPYSGIQTPKVTPTFTNTSGLTNTTGLTEAVCSHDTKNMGIFQVLMNNIACAGVTGAVAQGFVLSAIIMFIFAMGLTRYGKGLGALAGVIIGAVVSWGMQLLPLWTLIVCIIMCGLIFAALITKQGSGG